MNFCIECNKSCGQNRLCKNHRAYFASDGSDGIIGPFYCGTYYKTDNPQHTKALDILGHPLSQNIISNKKPNPKAVNELCELMYEYLMKHEYLLNDVMQIIPVPLHKCHTEICPYNCVIDSLDTKAESLAKKLSEMIQKKMNIFCLNDVLVKVKGTNPLEKRNKTRSGALEAAKIKYKINNDILKNQVDMIKDKTILLIDDLVTTGATTKVCSSLLRNYGAKRVNILCAASTEWKK